MATGNWLVAAILLTPVARLGHPASALADMYARLLVIPAAIIGLGYLFYPWGYIVQIVALVHFFRRRPDGFWIWVIFLGGFIGAVVYIVAEMLPDAGLLRHVYQGQGRRSRIAVVETAILDNPSAANLEELGELYWDEKKYAEARDAYDRALRVRGDSPHSFYRRGLCSMELGQPDTAVPDLELVVRADPKFDSYRAELMLARAYAATGRLQEAAPLFAEVMQHSNTPEALYSYAVFLKSQNRSAEAREWAQQLLQKRRTLPRYWERIERPWFRKGEALLKELSAP
jgi:hypothetical protein